MDSLFEVDRGRPTMQRVVDLAHRHLRLDMVIVTEICGERLLVRAIAGDGASFGVTVGYESAADASYTRLLMDNRIPALVADAHERAELASMGGLRRANARAVLGIPLRRTDGSLYGALAGVSHTPDATLGERDVRFLAMLADLITPLLDEQRRTEMLRDSLTELIEGDRAAVAFQPVVDVRSRTCLGVEALARFPEPFTRIEEAFASAYAVGMGFELERLIARMVWPVLEQLHLSGSGRFLAVNLTPGALLQLAPRAAAYEELPLQNLVVEMTENALVESYELLRGELTPLRRRGMRIGIDDAGAGYASFRHVVELHPDFIKIDRSLIHGIARDRARQVTVRAFLGVALDLGATLVAEGVECPDDLAALQELGVVAAQGFLLAAPSTDRAALARWLKIAELAPDASPT